jgi:hypothetical protein
VTGMRRRWLAALAAVAVVVAGVVVLRAGDPDPPDAPSRQGVGIREGGTVRVASTFEVSGFNPNTSKDYSPGVQDVAVSVYPSVFRIQPNFTVRLDHSFMMSAELTSQDPPDHHLPDPARCHLVGRHPDQRRRLPVPVAELQRDQPQDRRGHDHRL